MKILGTGSALPDNEVTNDMLAAIVDTSDAWIASRTGIRSRRISDGDTALSLSLAAAERAISDAGIERQNIALIVCATVTNESTVPSLACLLQRDLGLPERVFAFDINAACTGFIYAMELARAWLRDGQLALLIGCERLSRVTDFTDRATCVLFGDGAGAAIVSGGASVDAPRFISGARGDANALHIANSQPCPNPFSPAAPPKPEPPRIRMDGQEVFRFAVDAVVRSVGDVLAQAGRAAEEIQHFVCHQANLRILESAARRLQVPLEKFFINITTRGNTSAASIPIALDELARSGRLRRGERVVFAGFGGGLTYGAIYMTW
jgi:3-oxoacyl-[acyl-carrier-protein] synthase-3